MERQLTEFEQKAITKFSYLKEEIQELKKIKRGEKFIIWYRDCELAIENFFISSEQHINKFMKINFNEEYIKLENATDFIDKINSPSNNYLSGLYTADILIKTFINEIKEYGLKNNTHINDNKQNFEDNIYNICLNFHKVASQLKYRHSDRETLKIVDEYDVQDLFHALLKLFYLDIREEEYTPSYAGKSTRTDFLLKNEKIMLEIKKSNNNLKDKQIGEQLTVDTVYYKKHPDCKKLICFVYDPDNFIKNPIGLENDLSGIKDGLDVKVYIFPKN